MPDPSILHHILEWSGSGLAALGAVIMAQNRSWSRIAWPIWILSNFLLSGYAVSIGSNGLLFLQVIYFAANVQGCYIWFWRKPRLKAAL